MTDRELLELLLQKVTTIETDTKDFKSDMEDLKLDTKNLNSDLKGLKLDTKNLSSDMKDLKLEVNNINNKLDDTEAQNASRHIQIISKIDLLTKDLAIVEAVTGKNMMDIGNLKAVK